MGYTISWSRQAHFGLVKGSLDQGRMRRSWRGPRGALNRIQRIPAWNRGYGGATEQS